MRSSHKFFIIIINFFLVASQYSCAHPSKSKDSEIGILFYYPFDIDGITGIPEKQAEKLIKCYSSINKIDFLELILKKNKEKYNPYDIGAVVKFSNETYYIDRSNRIRKKDKYYLLKDELKLRVIFNKGMKCKK